MVFKYLKERWRRFMSLDLSEKIGIVLGIVALCCFVACILMFVFALPSKLSQMLGIDLDVGVMAFIVICIWGGWFIYKDWVRWYSLQPTVRNDCWSEFAGNFILPYIEKVCLKDMEVDVAEFKSAFKLGYDLSALDDDSRRRVKRIVRSKILNEWCNCDNNFLDANYRISYDKPFLIIEKAQCGIFGDGTDVGENSDSAPLT